MELLSLVLFALSILVLWFKPQKEKLSFGLFLGGTAICFGMFFIASWTSVLPHWTF
ncbi:hypothetical protein [Campylobacter geochelonis]|uniref:Uncharacterized protein n=1 Tax=Campylobacter geochelonis TaxID=1780362 RepID=A0A128EHH6_9BACT|nr:hypothetical protein [Campylobacter geochelonis]QKF72001.1 putative membrane protein [Campylobacter geochelonis]CZE47713.1 Uncharacterised protein [Campylobacter geochelonis]